MDHGSNSRSRREVGLSKIQDRGRSMTAQNRYAMRISRLTVDKLGVKLHDRVSAVIAELIANSYDADATRVTVSAPMGKYLATRSSGKVRDKGNVITIADNGSGMTPEEMQNFFLVIGSERRTDSMRGPVTHRFNRMAMGRKGIGKLAPFGICREIEIVSSGGHPVTHVEDGVTRNGYMTSHITLRYDDIIAEHERVGEPYRPQIGKHDGTLLTTRGTCISLSNFNFRKVPAINTLSRQIAQRFGISSNNWKIFLRDNTHAAKLEEAERTVGRFDIVTMPNTRVEFKQDENGKHRVIGPDGNEIEHIESGFEHFRRFFAVHGWVAYSKQPYRDDLMAGVRIYCRGKIAAQTSVFGRRAGFVGEHYVRSHLVGELFADWLDEDEDLIQTDRKDILWSDELCRAFQEWGQRVVVLVGELSKDPMRKSTMDLRS